MLLLSGNSFNWISYIQQTQSIAAPESLFHAVPDENLMKNNFKVIYSFLSDL